MADKLNFEEDVRILLVDSSIETDSGDVIDDGEFEDLRKGILELVENWLPSVEEMEKIIDDEEFPDDAAKEIRKFIMDKFGLKE